MGNCIWHRNQQSQHDTTNNQDEHKRHNQRNERKTAQEITNGVVINSPNLRSVPSTRSIANSVDSTSFVGPTNNPRPPNARPRTPNKQIVLVALHDYTSVDHRDLSFAKGDLMILIDNSYKDWLYVLHRETLVQGYVSNNFVADIDSHDSEPWFHGQMNRNLAEQLLKEAINLKGTFLVRQRCGEYDGELALSIKDTNAQDGSVKHYRVMRLENGGFFIRGGTRTFTTLQDMITFYTSTRGSLCCKLETPCRKMAADRRDLSRETQENWEILRTSLVMDRKLGAGNFGEVYLATYNNNFSVAVKTLKPGTMTAEKFMDEAKFMKHCRHPNLVRLFAVVSKSEPLLIVTEYMASGNLLEYLRGTAAGIPCIALIDITAQVADGMSYLETSRIIHRDLAARNVLVGGEISGVPRVKVADFGLARVIVDEDKVYLPMQGTSFPIKWTAPEALSKREYTMKSDVWSFGVLLFEIFTRGGVPYQNMSKTDVIDQVRDGYRLPKPDECPDVIYDEQMLRCFDINPDKRPTFQSLADYFGNFYVASDSHQYQ